MADQTPNPNPSPEFIDEITREIWDAAPIRTHAEARDLADTIATLSQTLPAPGEVEAILKTAQADCGCRIPAPFDEVAEHAIGLALATVAAANDEAFARGVEAAAKVADAETGTYPYGSMMYGPSVGPKIAAAIRLLPQGGGKA